MITSVYFFVFFFTFLILCLCFVYSYSEVFLVNVLLAIALFELGATRSFVSLALRKKFGDTMGV